MGQITSILKKIPKFVDFWPKLGQYYHHFVENSNPYQNFPGKLIYRFRIFSRKHDPTSGKPPCNLLRKSFQGPVLCHLQTASLFLIEVTTIRKIIDLLIICKCCSLCIKVHAGTFVDNRTWNFDHICSNNRIRLKNVTMLSNG